MLRSRCRKSRFRFTSYSQRNAPPSLHIPHTTTSLDPDFRTDQMQIWTHLLQSLYRWFCPLLSLRTAAALQPFPFFPILPDTRMLNLRCFNRKSFGFRSFSCFGPHIWKKKTSLKMSCTALCSCRRVWGFRKLVNYSVRALSPVTNLKLYQGWKRTSIHLLVTLRTCRLTSTTIFLQHGLNSSHLKNKIKHTISMAQLKCFT